MNETLPAEPLAEPLKQAVSRVRRPTTEAVYRCPVCLDSGWETLTAGTHRSVGSSTNPGGVLIDATTTDVVRRCKGPQGRSVCPYMAHAAEERRRHKAQAHVESHAGAEGGGL